MVHGAGNALWGPSSIKAKWYPALADGLAWHGASIDEADVTVAFYGDLFRADPERGYRPPLDLEATLARLSRVTTGAEPEIDLDEMVKVLAEQHLDRMLAQAGAYFADPAIRRTARRRLEAAVGPDTRVLIAHSLGTVVAYEALCGHPEWPVSHFVTLGCPLGGEVIREFLEPAAVDGRGEFPTGLSSWTNVRNADDPACQHRLAHRFPGVVDRAVDNGHRVHDPEPYLNNPVTGAAVAEGLGA